MSYNISCKDSKLHIRNEKAALAALIKKHGEPVESLEAFFENQGWELERASNHISLRYSNTMPKDLFDIFETLARFVEDGSYLVIEGEEDLSCRIDFKGGKIKTTDLPNSKSAVPPTSIVAPKPGSIGPKNTVSFETISRPEASFLDEILIRVHLGDLSSIETFFPDLVDQFKSFKMGCPMSVRLISITLTGGMSVGEFADRWKSAIASEPSFLLFLTPILRAEVHQWLETGYRGGPVSVLDRAAIEAVAAEVRSLLEGPKVKRRSKSANKD